MNISIHLFILLSASSFLVQTVVGEFCDQKKCGTNAQCIELRDSAQCRCPPGYESDAADCCKLKPRIPGECEKITSNLASCSCKAGYEVDAYFCCESYPRASCKEFGASSKCQCLKGTLNSINCCRERNNTCKNIKCGPRATCVVNKGISICRCDPGWYGDPYVECKVVDVCAVKKCGTAAQCLNIDYKAVCRCPPGFEGNPEILCTKKIQNCKKVIFKPGFASCQCKEANYLVTHFRCCKNITLWGVDGCTSDTCIKKNDCRRIESSAQTQCQCRDGRILQGLECCKDINFPCGQLKCPKGALCVTRDGISQCQCARDHIGDPYVECENSKRTGSAMVV